MRRLSMIFGLTALTATLFGCGSDSTGPDGAAVASVTVTPDSATVHVGDTMNLQATAEDSDGNELTARTVDWASSDTSVATVEDDGMVTGISFGRVHVIATSGGASDTAAIQVNEGPDPSLDRIEPVDGTVGTEVRLIGQNFRTGARVFFDALESDSVDVANDTLVFAIAPDSLTTGSVYDVTLLNRDSTFAVLGSAFTAVEPELAFVNGATKPSGKTGSTVVIDGDAFGDLQGEGKVLFSDGAGGTIEATIASEDDWTNTFILTTVPSGVETGDLVVTTATGTSDPLTFTVTSDATFSPSAVDWTQTVDLPVAVSGHAAVFVPIDDGAGNTIRHVHVSGGSSNDSVPLTDVNFAVIQSDGTLSGWTGTSSFPEARAFHASVVATPFNSRVQGDGWLYALGGVATKGGDPVATVLRAPLNSDGTVGSWSQTTPLPEPLHSFGAVIFRSSIYIVGGATTGNSPVSSAYRAAIDTLGQIGQWESLPAVPTARSYHQLTVLGNCLHAFGGDSAAVAPEDDVLTDTRYSSIVGARIDLRTSNLTSAGWSLDDTTTPKSREKHTALIAGGGVLLTAGIYEGIGASGSSENMFAQIASDCDVADFGGANNNKSIKSKNGGNLFNHTAISYVDAGGVAHVMVLGGDDIDDPGVKRKAVWFF